MDGFSDVAGSTLESGDDANLAITADSIVAGVNFTLGAINNEKASSITIRSQTTDQLYTELLDKNITIAGKDATGISTLALGVASGTGGDEHSEIDQGTVKDINLAGLIAAAADESDFLIAASIGNQINFDGAATTLFVSSETGIKATDLQTIFTKVNSGAGGAVTAKDVVFEEGQKYQEADGDALAGTLDLAQIDLPSVIANDTAGTEPTAMTVTLADKLTLTGTPGGDFVKVTDKTGTKELAAADVNFEISKVGADFTLGMAGANNSGTIGDVKLANVDAADQSVLTTLGAGTINIGDIEASADGTGGFDAKAATTNTGSIGIKDGHAVESIKVGDSSTNTAANLNVNGDVNTNGLALNGAMEVKADAGNTLNGNLTIANNGTVEFATGASLKVAGTLTTDSLLLGENADPGGAGAVKNVMVTAKNVILGTTDSLITQA